MLAMLMDIKLGHESPNRQVKNLANINRCMVAHQKALNQIGKNNFLQSSSTSTLKSYDNMQ
jgi:hypothetical protein